MKQLVQFLNNLLEPLGIRLSRVRRPKLSVVRPGVVAANVGKATLVMPANSSIPYEYHSNPNYGSQIGRASAYLNRHLGEYLAIDVGANVGDTLSIIRQAADVPVLCVEGDPNCIKLFRENSSGYDRVELLETFLSESDDQELVTINKEGWNTTLSPGDADAAKMISFRTLDSVAAETVLPCGLLKLDVEGYEWRILRGARKILARDQPILCIEYNIRHSGFPPDEFIRGIEELRDLGYDKMLVYESQGALLQEISLASEWDQYLDLHHFLRASSSPLNYVDITIFPGSKSHLFEGFQIQEREHARHAANRH